jgi:hypothetical protein
MTVYSYNNGAPVGASVSALVGAPVGASIGSSIGAPVKRWMDLIIDFFWKNNFEFLLAVSLILTISSG